MTTSIEYMPLAVRCSLEYFAASGERTKDRLTNLMDHYFRAYGMQDDSNRSHYEEQAFAVAQRRYSLGAAEGF